ncbi:antA/AntB antirepressor family protein [Cellulosilyticum sp. ST5]|uniref:antA/AntB antirepressor family protein n=1 Tax=Cellulosilyticum sp. ST5 TaxID=3055805 RepID=UPI003977903E
MNNVINIPIDNGEVSARKLHNELKVDTRFNDWIARRISEYGFEENLDFTIQEFDYSKMSNQKRGGDRKSVEYKITLGMAKELAMLEKNEIGRRIRKYFIKCEENLIEAVKKNMIPKEMYLDAVQELEETSKQNEQLLQNYNDIRLMYQNTTNEVAEYVNTQIKYLKAGKIKCNDLYNHYCRWCRNTPHYEPYPKQQFEDLLLERMVQGHSIKKDGSNYIGIEVCK